MALVEVPLGGANKNYNSRESRARAINCYVELNADRQFTRIRRSPGLRPFVTVGDGPIRGMYELKNVLYVVSADKLYSVDENKVVTELGTVGGTTTLVDIDAIGTDANEVMVVSDGNGYLYDTSTGFRQITDVNFNADISVASLNQVFWTNDPGSNVFRGSATADGDTWPPLRFGSAEQNPDPIVYVVALKTNLWIMGTKSIEYWQTIGGDPDLPLRPVAGATIERGVGAPRSVAKFQDNVFFLGDDFAVHQIGGSGYRKISDLSLEYAIRGDGFNGNTGYVNPKLAEGFFIDHPSHKLYVLTFPADGATWIYDLTTGLWHERKSKGLDRWRARESTIAFNKVLCGDFVNNNIWELADGYFKEGDDELVVELITPSISSDKSSLYISKMELIGEVGVGSINNVDELGIPKPLPLDPEIILYYSKDGGVTFKQKERVSLGRVGDRRIRVTSRKFGRTMRSFNFVFKFVVSDDVPVFFYQLAVDAAEGS